MRLAVILFRNVGSISGVMYDLFIPENCEFFMVSASLSHGDRKSEHL